MTLAAEIFAMFAIFAIFGSSWTPHGGESAQQLRRVVVRVLPEPGCPPQYKLHAILRGCHRSHKSHRRAADLSLCKCAAARPTRTCRPDTRNHLRLGHSRRCSYADVARTPAQHRVRRRIVHDEKLKSCERLPLHPLDCATDEVDVDFPPIRNLRVRDLESLW